MGSGYCSKCKTPLPLTRVGRWCNACAAPSSKRWRAANRERANANQRRWAAAHRETAAAYRSRPEVKAKSREQLKLRSRELRSDPAEQPKIAARDRLNKAIRAGKVKRAPCEVCGAPKAHGHHDDYARPLDVRWLCPTHHKLVHLEP